MYGNYYFPNLPYGRFDAGVDLGGCVVLPTGGNVVYLRSTGPADYDPPALTGRIVTTLAAALAQCRADKADTILVLPGHSESVADATMLDNLVDGTKIIGIGRGGKMPTFRWTATGSSWAVDNNDVLFSGLRLRLEGANGVTKAINITGDDVAIRGCDIQTASGASNKATICIEVGSGADRTEIVGNILRGTATHNSTDVIKVVGSTVPDGLRICDNEMVASATAGNGFVNVTVAATHLKILRNIMANTHTSSTSCITFADAASTGVCAYNALSTLNDGTVTAQGIILGSACLVRCFENYSCDEPKKSGVLTPAAAT